MKKLYTLSVIAIMMVLASCSKETDNFTNISDASLSSLISQTDLQEINASVARKKQQTFRIRMNSIAKNSIGGKGEMSAHYAVNSMLVKEYLDIHGEVSGYDVMYKAPADPNTSGGWLWASYDAEGNPTYSVNLRGASCNSCHGKSSNLIHDF